MKYIHRILFTYQIRAKNSHEKKTKYSHRNPSKREIGRSFFFAGVFVACVPYFVVDLFLEHYLSIILLDMKKQKRKCRANKHNTTHRIWQWNKKFVNRTRQISLLTKINVLFFTTAALVTVWIVVTLFFLCFTFSYPKHTQKVLSIACWFSLSFSLSFSFACTHIQFHKRLTLSVYAQYIHTFDLWWLCVVECARSLHFSTNRDYDAVAMCKCDRDKRTIHTLFLWILSARSAFSRRRRHWRVCVRVCIFWNCPWCRLHLK